MNLETVALGLAAVVAVEQVLASVPAVKSNSTFQLICNLTNSAVELGKKMTLSGKQ